MSQVRRVRFILINKPRKSSLPVNIQCDQLLVLIVLYDSFRNLDQIEMLYKGFIKSLPELNKWTAKHGELGRHITYVV